MYTEEINKNYKDTFFIKNRWDGVTEDKEAFSKCFIHIYGCIPNQSAFDFAYDFVEKYIENDYKTDWILTGETLVVILSLLFPETYNIVPNRENSNKVNYIWRCVSEDLFTEIVTFRVCYKVHSDRYFDETLDAIVRSFGFSPVDIIGNDNTVCREFTFVSNDYFSNDK